MWDVNTTVRALLQSRSRNLMTVVELYAHDYTPFPDPSGAALSFDPRFALKRFAGQSVSFSIASTAVVYERQVIDVPSINKHIKKEFDTATIKMSNVDRSTAAWVLNNQVQGMRLIVRYIPRSAPISGSPGTAGAFVDSFIEFVGRCNKPDGFTRASGTISATQDLGTIQALIPPKQHQPSCPLVSVFKKPGHDCMGSETLDQKSATYKAAKSCNGSFAQCTDYSNTEHFQGIRIIQITSSFVHKSHRGFFTKLLAVVTWPVSALPWFRRTKTVVGNSVHDGTPYGTPISLILGRWKKQLIALQFKDTGQTIWAKFAACRGTIKDFLNLRQEAPNFSQPLNVVKHLGEYGGVGTQTQDAVFPDASFHSKLAYLTASFTGSDVKVEDPAPDVSAVIAGSVVPFAFGSDGAGRGRIQNILASYEHGSEWSDNPVNQAFFVITEPSLLNVPMRLMAQKDSCRTSFYCDGAIKDVSNAERCLLPDTETTKAGVDYKRYMSTGVIRANNFLNVNQGPGGISTREATYEFFDPDAPPTSLALQTFYRKRFTGNIEINEQKKAVDFLYDTLLPTFRGFLKWDRFGRIHIDCERPADHSFLRQDVAVSATSVKVLDVFPWNPPEGLAGEPDPLRGKILIGTGKLHSEVRPVTSINYSADGNAVTLTASGTGSWSITASGATLSGGSSSVAASGHVRVDGTPVLSSTVTITIDGFVIQLTTTAEDVSAPIGHFVMASQLAYAINAEPILKEYVEASVGNDPVSGTRVLIACKFGVLNFTTPLEEDHFAEIDDPTVAPTLAQSAGALDAGAYLVAYAYRNANGNTNLSPIANITLTASKQIDVTGISLPAGATSVDWFVSVEANSGTMLLVNNNNGSGFSINALPISTDDDVPKRNTTGEEILRITMSFADKALVYADTAKSNVLDGSFGWPEGGRQSTVNQVKGKYREAIRDFGEQPLTINDERHQETTGQTNSAEIDLSCVDNFNQASRLCNGYLAKLRDTDFFFKHGSAGEALLLEIGDVICLSDPSGAWRNVAVRIEDINSTSDFKCFFTSRLYATSVYDDEVLQTDVPLPSALTNYLTAPDIMFNTVDFPPDGLIQSTDGTAGITSIRGGAIFGASIYSQYAEVRVILRGGVVVNELVAIIRPNDPANGDWEAVFEFLASVDGLYRVQLQSFDFHGIPGNTVTADIVIGLGTNQGQWITPMVTFSGAADSGPSGGGTYTIP